MDEKPRQQSSGKVQIIQLLTLPLINFFNLCYNIEDVLIQASFLSRQCQEPVEKGTMLPVKKGTESPVEKGKM